MEKKIFHQGIDIHYDDVGEGEVVVLIHGFAEDRQIWDKIVGELSAYRLIIPDLPGSGSSPLSRSLTIETMAESVVEICNQEKVQEAIIIGHSMGGYIALAVMEKHENRMKALGLFHSTAFPDNEDKKASRLKNIDFIRAHGVKPFLKQSIPALFGERFKHAAQGAIDQLIEKYEIFSADALIAYLKAMMERPDRRHLLINTSKPVFFIIGRHDVAVPFEDSLRLCHLPSLSYIHILDHSGHMGMIEDPEMSVKALKNFIKDLTG